MKKFLAMLIACGVVMSSSRLVFAENPDNKHIWQFDSGNVAQITYSTSESVNTDAQFVSDNDDLFTIQSPSKIESITFKNNEDECFQVDWKGRQETQDTTDGTWSTILHFYKVSPMGNFKNETAGTEYTADCVIMLTDGQSMTVPSIVRMVSSPFIKWVLEDGNTVWDQTAPRGEDCIIQTDILDKANQLDHINYQLEWEIESGSKYAVLVVDGNETTKFVSSKENRSIILRGKTNGKFTLRTSILDENNQRIATTRHNNCQITGVYETLPDETVSAATDALSNGDNATIEVPNNAGLTSDIFTKLKDAAKDGAQVTLKQDDDDRLTLTFDPGAIDDEWAGDFTPSFTPTIPDKAAEQGFAANGGKWIQFGYSGQLPAPMTVTLAVNPNDFPNGATEFKVWQYDESGVAREVATNVSYQDGKITFTLTHFSTYAVFPKEVDLNATAQKPSSGGSSSGGGGGSSARLTTTSSTEFLKVTAPQAKSAASKAIKQAKVSGQNIAAVQFKNVSSLTKEALSEIAKVANAEKMNTVVYADLIEKQAVAARIAFDPTKYSLDSDLETGIQIDDPSVKSLFAKHFQNPVRVLKFAQNGSFGMSIDVAVKLDLSEINPSDLTFYSYDPAANRYTQISKPNYWIDSNGYLHFSTDVGGNVVISSGALVKKHLN